MGRTKGVGGRVGKRGEGGGGRGVRRAGVVGGRRGQPGVKANLTNKQTGSGGEYSGTDDSGCSIMEERPTL